MTTLENLQSKVEVWLNTSAGSCWYKALDLQGRSTTKSVRGGRTFTLTTFERQLNQSDAASPEQDLFRNGTFVLQKASGETLQDEVSSPNAWTDTEIDELVREVVHGTLNINQAIEKIDSSLTLNRILQGLVIEDAPASVTDAVRSKRDALSPGRPMERTVVTTAANAEKPGANQSET